MFAFCSPENFATNFVTTAPDADVTCSMKGDVTPLIAPFRFAADRDNSLVLLASLICVRSSTGSEGFSVSCKTISVACFNGLLSWVRSFVALVIPLHRRNRGDGRRKIVQGVEGKEGVSGCSQAEQASRGLYFAIQAVVAATTTERMAL